MEVLEDIAKKIQMVSMILVYAERCCQMNSDFGSRTIDAHLYVDINNTP